ncbi:restriction endonuclease [uncultured Methanobacterium sp.]|uniref:restriction endonuclease n=1 Tax=uncultured Methanobacterium sp. TaxID=176306 RepID=UPI002AA72969|nr:restriction endonuclease [uncultured Methanobacterium sp.]
MSYDNLFEKLDWQKFVELIADILYRNGHSNIKIVDGTGDGGRDIHSIAPGGENHLTQCKFQSTNSLRTVSSRETGELPLAMMKFGYQKGLFATNGKISPQSQREYISDYPDLNLDFIQGKEIIKTVFNDLILRKIWYDGESIDKISYNVTIPFFARDLVNDKLIQLEHPEDGEKILLEGNEILLQLKFQDEWVKEQLFEPYRSSTIKTIMDPYSTSIHCMGAVLEGIDILDNLDNALNGVFSYLLEYLKQDLNDGHSTIAIRSGVPYLNDELSEVNVELLIKPKTFIIQDKIEYYEYDWLIPSKRVNWWYPEGIHVLESSWVRWHNPKLDLCLDLNILSSPDNSSKRILQEHHDFFVKWWKKSLFAVVPTSKSNFHELDIPKPTCEMEWCKDDILCGWLHGNLLSELRPMLLESNDDSWDEFTSENERYLKELEEKLLKLEFKMIKPEKARHMFALSNDPYPITDRIRYRSVELLIDYSDLVVSPIDPESRIFEFQVYWSLDNIPSDKVLSNIREEISAIMNSKQKNIDFVIENINGLKNPFIAINFEFLDLDLHERTDEILEYLEPILSSLLDEIEQIIKKYYPNSKRATKEFWKFEIGLVFPEN